jgi:general stress protein 26
MCFQIEEKKLEKYHPTETASRYSMEIEKNSHLQVQGMLSFLINGT